MNTNITEISIEARLHKAAHVTGKRLPAGGFTANSGLCTSIDRRCAVAFSLNFFFIGFGPLYGFVFLLLNLFFRQLRLLDFFLFLLLNLFFRQLRLLNFLFSCF